MKFEYQPYEFEQIYRPVYELHISMAWLAGAFVSYFCNYFIYIDSGRINVMQSGICIVMALLFFFKGFGLYRMQCRLLGTPLEFIGLKDFIKKVEKNIKKDEFYLGQGFTWSPLHTRECTEILKLDWVALSKQRTLYEFVQTKKKAISKQLKEVKGEGLKKFFLKVKAFVVALFSPLAEKHEMGQKWIHGLNEETREINVPASWFNGHLLILGTTGSGKTRLADLLCTQCIMRGEALVIIDPKGDREMLTNAKNATRQYRDHIIETTGHDPGPNFFYFHPADPEHSARINFLANSSRDTDISTRITNLIPSANGGFDPFTSFGWMSINAIVQAMLYIGKSPTINAIKMDLLDSMESLTSEAVDAFCTRDRCQ